ncbi:MAG: 50S ribosomal protein L4 [Proteobacteria bacterium]|jgi:large subunit ribosomal protein L4|nr:50S ribosomal protein L4 [Pseudomonadota bacterium]
MIIKSNTAKEIEVTDKAFAVDYNESLVHQVIVSEFSNRRSGTKAQKNRSAVSGGGKKPWRQKGTGRARAGTTRSNIWVGGGRAFAAQPRDHSKKINKKMYLAAMRSIFSELHRQERLVVVDDFQLEAPKTKKFVEKVKSMGISSALVIVESFDENLWLSARNLHGFEVCLTNQINPISLIEFENVIVTSNALKIIEERLS